MSYADTLLADGERVTSFASGSTGWRSSSTPKWAWLALLVRHRVVLVDGGPLAKGDNGGLVDLAQDRAGLRSRCPVRDRLSLIGAGDRRTGSTRSTSSRTGA